MASTLTYTGKTGPGATVTAQTTSNVREVHFYLGGKNVLQVVGGDNNQVREYDLNATTTVTCTITAGGNATFAVSQ